MPPRANFLLAWHNAEENGGWDPTDLWNVDTTVADDLLTVLKLASEHMAHITVYLPNKVDKRVRNAARRSKTTVNKWIAQQITNAITDRLPDSFLAATGAVPDFPSLEEIRSGYGEDRPRDTL